MTSQGEASPYPQAMEQWTLRHQTWADRPVYQAFEPHMSPALKALRDHVVPEEEGVTTLVGLLSECASSNTIAANREQLGGVAGSIEEALASGLDDQLDIALQQADSAIGAAVERYEVRALGVPGVTEAFAREVLVDEPLHDSEPISEDDLAGLLDFEDSPEGDENSGGTTALKLTRFGKVLYHLHTSIGPAGIRDMFATEVPDMLNGKTPREVIDTGAPEYDDLLDWAKGLHGTAVS